MPSQSHFQPSGGVLVPRAEDTALDRVLALALPPLLPGENKVDFLALTKNLVAAAEPEDAIEEILVRDVIDLSWEIRRLRQAKAGLLTVSFGAALKLVMETIGLGYSERESLSKRWMAGEKEAQQTVHKALYEANLSEEDVTAQTMEIKLDSYERLDRMLASAEARRNNALREIDRHRETLGVATRRALEEAEDAAFTDVETGVVHPSSD